MDRDVLPTTSVKGRVLTRHLVQQSGSLWLHYYVKTAEGPVLVQIPNADYLCFCATSALDTLLSSSGLGPIRTKALALQNFELGSVTALYCQSRQSFRNLTRASVDLGIPLYESDIRPEHRYLIERFIALDVEFTGEFSTNKSNDTLPVFIGERARDRKSVV